MALRRTHAARQLQESSGALNSLVPVKRAVEKTSLCCMFAHCTPHFTSMPASSSPGPSIFTTPNRPHFHEFIKITKIERGIFLDPQGIPRSPPGTPRRTPGTPRRTPGTPRSPPENENLYPKHLSGVKLPIARLWRPVCY